MHEGRSSVDPVIHFRITASIKPSDIVLVILDSDHTNQVAKEFAEKHGEFEWQEPLWNAVHAGHKVFVDRYFTYQGKSVPGDNTGREVIHIGQERICVKKIERDNIKKTA